MSERQPDGYQHKHHKIVSLDEYRGVARDIMVLNDPVADGFMQTGDMRGDIVIVQKPQDRALDYDQLGTVRVAKLLKMPRMDVWRNNNSVQTRKDGSTWYIAVNDQELAQNVARSNEGRKFDDAYIDAFQQEVKKGMKAVLTKEKLLNGGAYNAAFINSYFNFLSKDLLLLPVLELEVLLQSSNPAEALQGSVIVASLYTLVNASFNGLNLLGAGVKKVDESLSQKRGFSQEGSPLPDYSEPFIRHSIPEYLMPTVPVDRLVRGLRYLRNHGSELVTKVE